VTSPLISVGPKTVLPVVWRPLLVVGLYCCMIVILEIGRVAREVRSSSWGLLGV
jgi:hypothetical protein